MTLRLPQEMQMSGAGGDTFCYPGLCHPQHPTWGRVSPALGSSLSHILPPWLTPTPALGDTGCTPRAPACQDSHCAVTGTNPGDSGAHITSPAPSTAPLHAQAQPQPVALTPVSQGSVTMGCSPPYHGCCRIGQACPLAPWDPPEPPLCLLALQPQLVQTRRDPPTPALSWGQDLAQPHPGGDRTCPSPMLTFNVPAFLPDLVHESLWGRTKVSGWGVPPSQVPSAQPPQGSEGRGPRREGPQWKRAPGPEQLSPHGPRVSVTPQHQDQAWPSKPRGGGWAWGQPRPPARYLGCARR